MRPRLRFDLTMLAVAALALGSACDDGDDLVEPLTCEEAGCDPAATCSNVDGQPVCRCDEGFTGDGLACDDLDECAEASACASEATCTNTTGSFTCACDDGFAGDGLTCLAVPRIVVTAMRHSCVLWGGGTVQCWGDNEWGRLGLGDTADRGDDPDEMGAALTAVDLGADRTATELVAGELHTCALLDDGRVKCWGYNQVGQLGLGDQVTRGDAPGEMGDALPTVDLGTDVSVVAVTAGNYHTCALLDDGRIKCWGFNSGGQLGIGDFYDRGTMATDMGDALLAVDLGTGRTAKALSASRDSTCAILDDDRVKCWGKNDRGQLGLGDVEDRGNAAGELGDSLPFVDLGTGRTAKALASGGLHRCALLDNDQVKCWGFNHAGQLGLGDVALRGDGPGEMGDALPVVSLGTGRRASSLAVGLVHTCAVLDDATIKCWGYNDEGELGLGDILYRGDAADEMGDELPAIDLGADRTATVAGAGGYHSCAVLDDHTVKCWGAGFWGQLGLGDLLTRGDEAGEMGDALPAVDLAQP